MKRFVGIAMVCFCMLGIVGCSLEKRHDSAEKKEIDYTVVEDADIPDELMDVINGKKSSPFKITFSDKENLFIAIGYGEQATGGYSITVDEIYQTSDSIEVGTRFEGPEKNEEQATGITYPYIVIKVENTEKTVKFLNGGV